jgi:putative peptide zinc metalloprotease protein
VVSAASPTVRVVIRQAEVALVRGRTQAVEVRLSSRMAEVHPALIAREVPAGIDRLPSRALGTTGGGEFPVDPTDSEGLRTLSPVFQLDLTLPRVLDVGGIGELVYVRFDHGAEPLALRAYRSIRRLLLSRFSV